MHVDKQKEHLSIILKCQNTRYLEGMHSEQLQIWNDMYMYEGEMYKML